MQSKTKKQLIEYFYNGFKLLNSSLFLYYIYLFLLSLAFSRNLLINLKNPLFTFINIFFFILPFFEISYVFSFPRFLQYKYEKKALDLKEIVTVTVKNLKRLIIPIILLGLIFVVLVSFINLIFVLLLKNKSISQQLMIYIVNYLTFFLLLIFYPFGFFSTIFFSIKQKSFFRSMILSFKFVKDNLRFSLTGMALSAILNFIYYFFSSLLHKNLLVQYLITIIDGYILFMITASSLLYFNDHYKEEGSINLK